MIMFADLKNEANQQYKTFLLQVLLASADVFAV